MKNLQNYIFIGALGMIVSGCATNLASRSAADIASNSVRQVDALSGAVQVYGPQVKPIVSKKSYIGVKAQLRTTDALTPQAGASAREDAYLDLVLNYTTATPSPNEARLYNQVSFAGGQRAELADFGDTIIDCRQTVREINHEPYYGYYPYYGRYGQYWGSDGWDRPHRRRRPHPQDDDGDTDEPDTDVGPDTRPGPHTGPHPDRRPGDIHDPERRRRPLVRPVHRRVTPSTTKPVVSRPEPKVQHVSRPKTVSRPAPARKTRPTPTRRTPASTSRAIDRVFATTSNSRTRSSRGPRSNHKYYPDPYYPQTSYIDYDIRYRCQRQETLRVLISKDRLDHAQTAGLVLYVRPQAGVEETIVLPANYINGFKLAAYAPRSENPAITAPTPPLYPARYKSENQNTAAQDQPRSTAAIIYGEVK